MSQTKPPPVADDRLMTPAETARAFRVTPKTVTIWANTGRLTAVWTPGGTRRYRASQVELLLGTPGDPA